MITTTTNMIFYMMCINIINSIDIHMRRETKSQNKCISKEYTSKEVIPTKENMNLNLGHGLNKAIM
jgi:hypothetical protein